MLDVLIIGGGPAGAAAAAVLATAGRDVLVVEKDAFPRFHIGESLLPGMLPYLQRIGIAEQVESAGFVRKYAAEFLTQDGRYRQRYAFADSLCGGSAHAYQVERSKFDTMLLSHAARCGAGVRQGTRAAAFAETDAGVSVQLRDSSGDVTQCEARFLLDASGQAAWLGARHRLREKDPELANFALFTQFRGLEAPLGDRAGDITIVLSDEGWWWFIPLGGDVTSVGVVAPRVSLRGATLGADYFEAQARECSAVAQRLTGRSRVQEFRSAVDYSYRCRRFHGDRWLLAGDAAAFLDPVFSTGVLLAVSGGVEAAVALDEAVRRGTWGNAAFSAYAEWLGRRIDIYSEFVKGFYRPEFVDLFMHPGGSDNARRAVTSLLAGHMEDEVVLNHIDRFLDAARANKLLPLSPRLPGRREAAQRLLALGES